MDAKLPEDAWEDANIRRTAECVQPGELPQTQEARIQACHSKECKLLDYSNTCMFYLLGSRPESLTVWTPIARTPPLNATIKRISTDTKILGVVVILFLFIW